jgi:hypothetical protein
MFENSRQSRQGQFLVTLLIMVLVLAAAITVVVWGGRAETLSVQYGQGKCWARAQVVCRMWRIRSADSAIRSSIRTGLAPTTSGPCSLRLTRRFWAISMTHVLSTRESPRASSSKPDRHKLTGMVRCPW